MKVGVLRICIRFQFSTQAIILFRKMLNIENKSVSIISCEKFHTILSDNYWESYLMLFWLEWKLDYVFWILFKKWHVVVDSSFFQYQLPLNNFRSVNSRKKIFIFWSQKYELYRKYCFWFFQRWVTDFIDFKLGSLKISHFDNWDILQLFFPR